MQHSPSSSLPPCHPTENLFGTYYEKGDLIARTNMESLEDPDDPLTNSNRYVLADITSFFTLLVGIYFPSVTGENLCFFLSWCVITWIFIHLTFALLALGSSLHVKEVTDFVFV